MTAGAAQERLCDVGSLAQDGGRRRTTREAGGRRCVPAQSPQPSNHLDNQHMVSYIRKQSVVVVVVKDLPLPTSIRALFRDAEIGDEPLLLLTEAAAPYDVVSPAVFRLFARKLFRFLCTGVSGSSARPASDLARRKLLLRPAGPDGSSEGGACAGSGGCGGGGGGGVDVRRTTSDDVSDDGDGLTRRCGTSTESMKTPLRLRLRTGCCGVGDGLRSPHSAAAAAGARGAVPNTANAVWSRRAATAASGVVGCKRLRWTSSRSASLSSSGAAARLLFGDRASASVLLARRLPSCGVPAAQGEASAMRSRTVAGRTVGLGGEFSLSAPFDILFGERRGDRGTRDGVERDVELVVKSSDVGMIGENTSPCWTEAVFDGREGEHVRKGAFGVDGGSTSFVGVRKGLESRDVSVVSDESSLSVTARVDDELQENAGSSLGTLSASSTVSTVRTGDLSTAFTSLSQALRQVTTGVGHPSSGTGSSA